MIELAVVTLRAHLDEEDPEKEKPGFKHGLRQGLRFLLGPFPLSIGLHVVVSRSAGGVGQGMFEPVMHSLRDMGTPGVLLSASTVWMR